MSGQEWRGVGAPWQVFTNSTSADFQPTRILGRSHSAGSEARTGVNSARPLNAQGVLR